MLVGTLHQNSVEQAFSKLFSPSNTDFFFLKHFGQGFAKLSTCSCLENSYCNSYYTVTLLLLMLPQCLPE